jgi:ParB-like chromosome segregation protein Spo0J
MKPIHIELRDIDSIVPYEQNAKIHDKGQVEKIAKSISEFGWDQPIVVDKHGVVIKGHGRRLAAIRLGLTQIPVLVRDDLTDDQVRAARLADNRVALGDVDSELLQQELASLEFDLEGIFDAKELEFMVADLAEMNLDAIVLDLDSAVAEQAEETMKKIDETDSRDVRIDKALGFKTIQGKDERSIARFMAVAEGKTGCEGAEAFVGYINELMAA